MSRARKDEEEEDGGKWIQHAVKKPGALHKDLGIPQGKKIPAKTLNQALHSKSKLIRERANLAKNFKKMKRGS